MEIPPSSLPAWRNNNEKIPSASISSWQQGKFSGILAGPWFPLPKDLLNKYPRPLDLFPSLAMVLPPLSPSACFSDGPSYPWWTARSMHAASCPGILSSWALPQRGMCLTPGPAGRRKFALLAPHIPWKVLCTHAFFSIEALCSEL